MSLVVPHLQVPRSFHIPRRVNSADLLLLFSLPFSQAEGMESGPPCPPPPSAKGVTG